MGGELECTDLKSCLWWCRWAFTVGPLPPASSSWKIYTNNFPLLKQTFFFFVTSIRRNCNSEIYASSLTAGCPRGWGRGHSSCRGAVRREGLTGCKGTWTRASPTVWPWSSCFTFWVLFLHFQENVSKIFACSKIHVLFMVGKRSSCNWLSRNTTYMFTAVGLNSITSNKVPSLSWSCSEVPGSFQKHPPCSSFTLSLCGHMIGYCFLMREMLWEMHR